MDGVDVTPQQLGRARSIILFVGGFAGFVYELVVDHTERPTILILLAGMMGLPAFIGRPAKPDPAAPPVTPTVAPVPPPSPQADQ